MARCKKEMPLELAEATGRQSAPSDSVSLSAQESARASFASLLSAIPMGAIVLDADLAVFQANPAAASVHSGRGRSQEGLAFEPLLRQTWTGDLPGELIDAICCAAQSGTPTPLTQSPAVRVESGAAEHYEWQVQRISLPDGEPGVVCFLRDVSGELRDRAAVAESLEERRRAAKGLQAIASRARCLLWYADVEDLGDDALHWTVRMADEEAARRFLPVELLPGHTYAMALSEARLPEDREKMLWGDQETRAGRSYRQEYRVRDARGHIRWMVEDVQIEPRGPNQWNAVGISIDITERKNAEQEREVQREEIVALNRRLRRAMAETHHRVKNNLQVVSALVDILAMAHGEQVPVGELVRIGQHICSLAAIHDLLTQDAKTTGGSDVILAGDIMDRLAPLLRSVVGQRGVRFHVEDVALAQQQGSAVAVLVNELVSNAVKHGKGEIEVAMVVSGDNARLSVSDRGPGFPTGFDALRASNTGLEIIESVGRHDLLGKTSYENRPDGGASVVVEFPRRLLSDSTPQPAED